MSDMSDKHDDKTSAPNAYAGRENRHHFLVDINTVLNLFGKRFFLIFYFGRHLHPRQQTMVNQRTAGNWLVIVFAALLLVGFVYGVAQMVMWRMDHESPLSGGNSLSHLAQPAPSQT